MGRFEAWEARKEYVDIGYCNRRGIKVAGTNESHHQLNVFTQVGHLALKMAFEAGYEIYGNKILSRELEGIKKESKELRH